MILSVIVQLAFARRCLGELSIFGALATTLFVFTAVLWPPSGTLVRWINSAEEVKHG